LRRNPLKSPTHAGAVSTAHPDHPGTAQLEPSGARQQSPDRAQCAAGAADRRDRSGELHVAWDHGELRQLGEYYKRSTRGIGSCREQSLERRSLGIGKAAPPIKVLDTELPLELGDPML